MTATGIIYVVTVILRKLDKKLRKVKMFGGINATLFVYFDIL
jgi:hypothetical protein